MFPAAGLADFLWHAAFGIEADIAALLSPTHLLLLSAGVLMFSGPLRSSWRRSSIHHPSGLGQAVPRTWRADDALRRRQGSSSSTSRRS
jgi:hypothetical protein